LHSEVAIAAFESINLLYDIRVFSSHQLNTARLCIVFGEANVTHQLIVEGVPCGKALGKFVCSKLPCDSFVVTFGGVSTLAPVIVFIAGVALFG
jgi:hypothetical protein